MPHIFASVKSLSSAPPPPEKSATPPPDLKKKIEGYKAYFVSQLEVVEKMKRKNLFMPI